MHVKTDLLVTFEQHHEHEGGFFLTGQVKTPHGFHYEQIRFVPLRHPF
jgi:hypothetical protein